MVNFKLARGPNSLMGVAATPEEQSGTYVNKKTKAQNAGAVALRIVPLEKLVRDAAAASASASASASSSLPPIPRGGVALLHPDNPFVADADAAGGIALLTLEGGSDFVMRCAAWPGVAPGTAALSEEQRYNIHVAEDQTASFRIFNTAVHAQGRGDAPGQQPMVLVDVQLELRLLRTNDARSESGIRGSGRATAAAEAEKEADEEDDDGEDDDDDDDDDDDYKADEEDKVKEGEGDGDDAVEVDGAALAAALSRRLAGRWVCAGELMMLGGGDGDAEDDGFRFLRGTSLRARVVTVNTTDPEEAATAIGYHCFRGVVSPDTIVYLHAEGDHRGLPRATGQEQEQEQRQEQEHVSRPFSSSSGVTTVGGGLRVINSRVRGDAAEQAAAAAAELVTVRTSDGEEFPVHRRLLRPCIALTRAIREAGVGGGLAGVSSGKREAWEREQHREQRAQTAVISTPPPASAAAASDCLPVQTAGAEASVDVDCATFDRVLLWLEAEALGRPPPDHDIRITEELAGAADVLGLRSLSDACRAKLGAHQSRIRRYRWSEIVAHNAAG